jgi:hypothetical protein
VTSLKPTNFVQSTQDPPQQTTALVDMVKTIALADAPKIVARIVRLGDWTLPRTVPAWYVA